MITAVDLLLGDERPDVQAVRALRRLDGPWFYVGVAVLVALLYAYLFFRRRRGARVAAWLYALPVVIGTVLILLGPRD